VAFLQLIVSCVKYLRTNENLAGAQQLQAPGN